MLITKNEELQILKMYNIVSRQAEETLDMTHLVKRILKKRKDWAERGEKK